MSTVGDALTRLLDDTVRLAIPGAVPIEMDEHVRRAVSKLAGTSPRPHRHPDPSQPPPACYISRSPDFANALPTAEPLRPGELVTIDIAIELDGQLADAARPLIVGEEAPSPLADLPAAATAVTASAIAALGPGAAWRDACRAMKHEAARLGVRIVPGVAAHGLLDPMTGMPAIHALPHLTYPPLDDPTNTDPLPAGLVLAIEPAVARGGPIGLTARVDPVTGAASVPADAACSAEHTVLLTPDGPRILAC